jgi:two-component sensor histidine kinase
MERLIGWLPKRPQPLHVRFAISTGIMAVCILVQAGQAIATTLPGLFFLFLGVFASSIAFGRGAGFYATLLGAASAYITFHYVYVPTPRMASVLVFTAVGFIIAFVSEALRNSFERAIKAERAAQVLLQELQHRTQNMLSSTVSLLELQARSSQDANVRSALEAAVARLRLQADVQRHLDPAGEQAVEVASYLARICAHHEAALRGVRPVSIVCHVESLTVSPAKALALGLITNELITNALKYAFPAGRPGRIDVAVTREPPDRIRLVVRDDGAGCPDTAGDGLGTRLIRELVREHGGTVDRTDASPGCAVTVEIRA